jgi:hypothetical protein
MLNILPGGSNDKDSPVTILSLFTHFVSRMVVL